MLFRSPLKVFTVVRIDGAPAIRISGEGYGVLSTRETFSNYHLRLEFKWGEKRYSRAGRPKNGGLMYHAHGEYGEWSGRWKSALQFQIAEGSCGDFIVMGDTTGRATVRADEDGKTKNPTYDPAGKPLTLDVTAANKGKCARSENFEKPAGEWNTFEVLCVGDKSVHLVNGRVVARADNFLQGKSGRTKSLTSGHIQLQLEAAEEYFRNIEIRPLDKIPPEYAELKK